MMSGSSMQAITRSLPPHLGQVRGEHAMEAGEVESWARHQGRQPSNEVERIEHDVRCAVAKGLFEPIDDLSPLVGRQPFVRDGRAGDIAAEFFQLIALFGLTAGRFITKSPGIDPGSSIAARNIALGTSSSMSLCAMR